MDNIEFKKLYQEIKDVSSVIKGLITDASNFISTGIDNLATEYDYFFIKEADIKKQLINSSKRMILARIGHLHTSNNAAFEDFSRAMQLQLEGLVNAWFKQYYFEKQGGSIEKFSEDYFHLKAKQFFSKQKINNVNSNVYGLYTSELHKLGASEATFSDDFNTLDFTEFSQIYSSVFEVTQTDIVLFKKRVFKIEKKDSIERMQYVTKIEFIFLSEKGIFDYFVYNPLSNLNQLRNAILSHSGTGLDKTKDYYTKLYNIANRFELLIEYFTQFFNIVRKQLADPPASDPPASDPPASDPPASDPPASDPPASDPPASDPPASDPPASDPPASDPPASDPPASDPPASDPPASDPPASDPPASDPPASDPPASDPPASNKKKNFEFKKPGRR